MSGTSTSSKGVKGSPSHASFDLVVDLSGVVCPRAGTVRLQQYDVSGGFWRLSEENTQAITTWVRNCTSKKIVVLAIGGSSLGGRAVCDALAPLANEPTQSIDNSSYPQVVFVDNIDPDTFYRALTHPAEQTTFMVISKSGGTSETLLLFALARQWLANNNVADIDSHFVFVTDPHKGPLREYCMQTAAESFAVPPDVGGRFSVLSPVGLLPAAAGGVDIDALKMGAQHMQKIVRDVGDWKKNPAAALAVFLDTHHRVYGRNVCVMLCYSDRLLSCGGWFRQLFAESLGKNGMGQTPVVARGVTDQHSQMQLYVDGPDDKVYIVISVESGIDSPPVTNFPNTFDSATDHLQQETLRTVLQAEKIATMETLVEKGRPVAEIRLQKVCGQSLGAFFMFWQAVVMYQSQLMGVNPLDQPGVELAKIKTKEILCGQTIDSAPKGDWVFLCNE